MTSFLSRQSIRMSISEFKPFMSLVSSPFRHQLRRRYCNNGTGQKVQNAKLYSTSSAPPSPSIPPPTPSGGAEPAKLSLFARFRQMYRDYYYVLIPVHLVTSIGWFGGFYYSSQTGVNFEKYMKKVGISEHLVDKITKSGLGHVAVAYGLYKIATPARYAVTLGGTTWAINRLKRLGYIKPAKEIILKGKERFLKSPPKAK